MFVAALPSTSRSYGLGQIAGAAAASRWAAPAAGLAALLTGCSHASLDRPNLALPQAYEGARATDAALPAQSLDRWWRLFEDAQLTGLIEQALIAAPDARTALQRIGEAAAARAQTLAGYYPKGDLTGVAQTQHTTESFGAVGIATSTAGGGAGTGSTGSTGSTGLGSAFLTPSGDLQTYGAQFNVTYELDLFGRRRAALRAANADLAAARFDYEATRSSLATRVATALFQARGDAIQLDDARETLRIAHDLARSADVSASHGLTSTSDAARLQTDVGVDAAETARLEAVEQGARRSLLALIGRGGEATASLPITAFAAAPPAPPAQTPGELLRRRPDVREAEAKLRSAANTLALDRLALFPVFNLAPGAQISKTGGTYDSLTSVWSIGLNAAMPVLDRPRLLAVIRGQRARGQEAVATYEQTVQNAYRDAETGLSTLAADRSRTAVLTQAVTHARFAFDAKKRGYDLGLTDLTTLLDAERSWRSTRSALTAAQITALVDAATLFQALGGGWTPPEPPFRTAQG